MLPPPKKNLNKRWCFLEANAIYELVQEAKVENKWVHLLTEADRYEDTKIKFVITPDDEISFKEGNVLKCSGTLIDLNFVVAAFLIDGKKDLFGFEPVKPIEFKRECIL